MQERLTIPLSDRPVVFLAFANERAGDDRRYLRNLPEELRRIRKALSAAEAAGHSKVVIRPNATLSEILDVFQERRDRISLFHFGGHSWPAGLQLETSTGEPYATHAPGLAAFLGQQNGLELVFLNGCSTRKQVDGLLTAGTASVVATSGAILDDIATEFAARFYEALAAGTSLAAAYHEATHALRARWGEDPRAYYRADVPSSLATIHWPWELHLAPGAEERVKRWSLANAARDPLWGLPTLPAIDLPNSPFKSLTSFKRCDAPIFFGRGAEIRRLYDAMNTPDGDPLVLLYGATGVGKTSLLDAGLRPRLETTHQVIYLRRDHDQGLTGTLAAALGGAKNLREAWLRKESQHPLIVILDQVEEAWTQPHRSDREIEDLADTLRQIFAVRERRPLGRLILSFRKEWLAEVRELLSSARLPFRLEPLWQLSRDGIMETLNGPAAIDKYRLSVEDGLPRLMAEDLLRDQGSAIGPTLQVLLTRMWQEVAGSATPHFTVDLYQALRQEGRLLDHFFEEQLASLHESLPEATDSGLAIDLLAFHTTPLGTGATRRIEDLWERYGSKRREKVLGLVRKCEDRYLLADPVDPADTGTTRLAHDILAPLVRQRFDASDLPGQRALRILEHRTFDWRRGSQGVPLDEADLAVVEKGTAGMRSLISDEDRLVRASQKARDRRRRRQRQLRWTLMMAMVMVAVSAGLAWWQRHSALAAQHRAVEAQEQTRALFLSSVASEWMARDPTRSALTLLEIDPQELDENAGVKLREAVSQPIATVILRGHQGQLYDASFSPDGTHVVTAGEDGTARVWRADGLGDPIVIDYANKLRSFTPIASARFSPDGRLLLIRTALGRTDIWKLEGWQRRFLYELDDWVLETSFSPDGRLVATGTREGSVKIWKASPQAWDDQTETLIGTMPGLDGRVYEVSFSPDSSRVLSAASGSDFIQNVDGSGQPIVLTIQPTAEHLDPRIHRAEISPDGNRVLTASSDDKARIWKADGSGKPVVLTHEDLQDAKFSPDGTRVVTTSQEGTIRVWSSDGAGEPVEFKGSDYV